MTKTAWIRTVDDEEASGDLKDLYDRVRDPETGHVDNIMRVHGLHPQSLADHIGLYTTTMHGQSGLSRAEREMIAVVVSSINECHY